MIQSNFSSTPNLCTLHNFTTTTSYNDVEQSKIQNTSKPLYRSWRQIQRREKRFVAKTLKKIKVIYTESLKQQMNRIQQNYGLTANPNKRPRQSWINSLAQTTMVTYRNCLTTKKQNLSSETNWKSHYRQSLHRKTTTLRNKKYPGTRLEILYSATQTATKTQRTHA